MKKLIEFKKYLRSKNIDAYIIPKYDLFFSEELMESDERLKFISNFSGSAGWGVITASHKLKSAIISDGRYQEQLKKEVSQKEFVILDGGLNKIIEFLNSYKQIKIIGVDTKLITINQFKFLESELKIKNKKFMLSTKNLVDEIWNNKPTIPQQKIVDVDTKYVGENFVSKIKRLSKIILNHSSEALITFKPDAISWLLNIRGNQLKYTPVVRCFALIHKSKKIHLFFEHDLPQLSKLDHGEIILTNINKFQSILKMFAGESFLVDYNSTPMFVLSALKKNKIKYQHVSCPISSLKVIKNSIEQKNFKEVHKFDGLAFIKFWSWFEQLDKNNMFDEEYHAKKLFEYRSVNKLFKSNSFPTISAFGKNGSVIHYRYSKGKSKKIKSNNLYLIDSGGQYLNGTTDVTRVLIHGQPTNDMKAKYTIVLKGHLSLSNLLFPKGTLGKEIDSIARAALWQNKMDYAHGTGHGVGFYSNVHEGPVSISKTNSNELKPGMVISNEPGYYGSKFGIRIENLELIKKVGNFLSFETLTLIPYEKKLIDKSLLSKTEINQINKYHKLVNEKIKPFMTKRDGNLVNFLNKKTSIL